MTIIVIGVVRSLTGNADRVELPVRGGQHPQITGRRDSGGGAGRVGVFDGSACVVLQVVDRDRDAEAEVVLARIARRFGPSAVSTAASATAGTRIFLDRTGDDHVDEGAGRVEEHMTGGDRCTVLDASRGAVDAADNCDGAGKTNRLRLSARFGNGKGESASVSVDQQIACGQRDRDTIVDGCRRCVGSVDVDVADANRGAIALCTILRRLFGVGVVFATEDREHRGETGQVDSLVIRLSIDHNDDRCECAGPVVRNRITEIYGCDLVIGGEGRGNSPGLVSGVGKLELIAVDLDNKVGLAIDKARERSFGVGAVGDGIAGVEPVSGLGDRVLVLVDVALHEGDRSRCGAG